MPLPTFASFVEEVARAVGGTAVALDTSEWPCSAVRVGARCALLIRDHHRSFLLSLPMTGSWCVSGPEDWAAAQPDIQRALGEQEIGVSISDVVARLFGGWSVDFANDPVPCEAWLRRGELAVTLSQTAAGATVAVWEGSIKHERQVASLAAIDGLAAWAQDKLALQARVRAAANAALAEAAARRAAFPPPELERVMAALRDGEVFPIGGGRCYPTYAMKDGQLVVIHFDEGYTDEVACDEEALRAAIAGSPEVFAEILERRKARP